MPGFNAFTRAHQITILMSVGAVGIWFIATAIDVSKPDGVPEFVEKRPLTEVASELDAVGRIKVPIGKHQSSTTSKAGTVDRGKVFRVVGDAQAILKGPSAYVSTAPLNLIRAEES